MRERLESFIALSVVLTGFSQIRLWGSGVAAEHLGVLDDVLAEEIVSDLMAPFAHSADNGAQEDAAATAILADPRLGPVARNLIVLWYSGLWTQLPASWRETYGESASDTTRTTSGAAYRAGLQWVVAGAHPPGASHQGFGAWSTEPKRRTL